MQVYVEAGGLPWMCDALEAGLLVGLSLAWGLLIRAKQAPGISVSASLALGFQAGATTLVFF